MNLTSMSNATSRLSDLAPAGTEEISAALRELLADVFALLPVDRRDGAQVPLGAEMKFNA